MINNEPNLKDGGNYVWSQTGPDISYNGNVCIGTTDVGNRGLHIKHEQVNITSSSANMETNAHLVLNIPNGGTIDDNGATGIFMAVSHVGLYGVSLIARHAAADGAPSFELATHSGSTLPSVRLTVSKDGKCGSNTTTPTEKLHVIGNTKIEGQLLIGTTAIPNEIKLAASGEMLFVGDSHNSHDVYIRPGKKTG